MDVIDNRAPYKTATLDELKPGDAFSYADRVFMKTDEVDIQNGGLRIVVSLESGEIVRLINLVSVLPLRARVELLP